MRLLQEFLSLTSANCTRLVWVCPLPAKGPHDHCLCATVQQNKPWINRLFCCQYINEFIVSLHPTVGKGENGAHFQLLICKTQFPYWGKQWFRWEPVTQPEEMGPEPCSLWAPQSPLRRDTCALKGFCAISPGTGWQLLSSKATLKCSLHSWAADKTLLTVSLSRDLTSSAVVSQVQMDPKLCYFNYSLSYLISLLVSVNSVLNLSNPLWQRLGALGAENLHQGNKEAASTSKPANSRLLTLTYDYNTPGIVKTQITPAPKTEK